MESAIVKERIACIRENLSQWNVDGILVGSPANRRWLSGFTGSAGWLLLTEDFALLATDFRYWEQAALQAPEYELHKLRKQMADSWQEFMGLVDVSSLGIEAKHLTVQQEKELREAADIKLIPLKETAEPYRAVKVKGEIELISKAAAISDQAMNEVPELIRPGMTEKEIAWKLEKFIREEGADAAAFPVIVASGPNGAMAHHSPGERQIKEGDSVIVDMGATIDGYNSDLTRTYFVGSHPDPKFNEVFDLVLKAQETALFGMRAGVTGRDADLLARRVIDEGGFGEEFGHSLGHGIGLDVHEDPKLSRTGETNQIPAGSVVTVEPGIYINGWGGIRLEDLVLVIVDGVEMISKCPKVPIISCT